MGESGKATMAAEKQLFYVKYPFNKCYTYSQESSMFAVYRNIEVGGHVP